MMTCAAIAALSVSMTDTAMATTNSALQRMDKHDGDDMTGQTVLGISNGSGITASGSGDDTGATSPRAGISATFGHLHADHDLAADADPSTA